MKEDTAFYKFRIKEIKDKYEEESSDEEDLIKKVLRKNKPVEKETATTDLEDYIAGKPVQEYKYIKDELDKKERAKLLALKKHKQRYLPVNMPVQTDPPPTSDFGIQIKDGEEVIPHIDKRSKSVCGSKFSQLEYLNEEIVEVSDKEHVKLHNRIKRSKSVIVNASQTPHTDLQKIVVQKFITNTDLHKIK